MPPPPKCPARRFVPAVAILEDRVTPAVHTWVGGGSSDNWSDAANWADDSAPATGETGVVVVFNTAVPSAVQDITGLVVDTVRFDAGAAVTVRVDADLTLNGRGATATVIDQSGRNAFTGAADLVLADGPAVILTEASTGQLTVSADVTGPQGIVKGGGGTLELATANANTYTGPTTVADGTLLVTSVTLDQGVSGTVVVGDGTGAAGTAVLRLASDLEVPNGAAVTVNGDGVIDLTTASEDITTLTLNGGQVLASGGCVLRILGGGTVNAGSSAMTSRIAGFGTFELAGPTVFTVADGPAARDLIVDMVVADAGVDAGLIKDGDGRLTLSADNSYGPTTVNAGVLEIDGLQPGFPLTVNGGALAGGGSVGAVTVGGAGTVAPGLADATGTAVRLRTEGATFTGGTFAVRLFGLGTSPGDFSSDRLAVAGPVDLAGATLVAVRLGNGVRPGFSFLLIDNDGTDPVGGTFAGLPEGATVTVDGLAFRISYQGADGNDVTLTYIDTFVPVNRPPVAVDDGGRTAAGTPVTVPVLANDFDPDGNPLAVILIAGPANGTAVVNPDGSITYTPNAGFGGVDSFGYGISDGQGGAAAATVRVGVDPPPNRPPVAAADAAGTAAGTPVTVPVLANDIDPDGNSFAVTIAAGPANGTAGTNADGTVTYTPNAGFSGTDTFTYTVDDGRGGAATAAVTITVTPPPPPPPNQPPVAAADTASVAAGTPVTINVRANDADGDGDPLTVTVAVGPANGTARVNADGSITYTPNAGFAGTDAFAYTVADGRGGMATAVVTITVTAAPTVNRSAGQFAVGIDRGGDGTARLLNADRSSQYTMTPFGRSGAAGVRVAAADFNGDGVADLVVGTGPGGVTRVRVLDGKTQQELFSVQPFEDNFTGGVYVTAGDVDGDGVADLVITPDEGGGPRVRVFSGALFGQIADFFGIDDTEFRGGARAAVADLTGDGVGDLIVAAGFGGGPRVAAFDGTSLGSAEPVKLFADFLAFEPALRNGVFITGGDLDGDGFADLIAGGGPGGGPRVRAFDGKALVQQNTQTDAANFFAGDSDNRGGVRLTAKDLDGDGRADIIAGAGPGGGSRVTAYRGSQVRANGTPGELFAFDAQAGFAGGVFVG